MRACRFSSVMSGSLPAKVSARSRSYAFIGSSIRRSIRSQPTLRGVAGAFARLGDRGRVTRVLLPPRRDRAEVDRAERERRIELRRARDELAVLIDRDRVAVDDELVLAPDAVAEDDRGQVVPRAL